MSGFYDERVVPKVGDGTAGVEKSAKELLIDRLQMIRDGLCNVNAGNQAQESLYASGYGAGVEAMWEAAEDLLKGSAYVARAGRIDMHGKDRN